MIRTSYRLMLAAFLLAAASVGAQDPLTVASVDEDLVTVAPGTAEPAPQAIFDVYRSADADGIYRELVDSVYFVSLNEEGELLFQTVWNGGGRYIEEGNLLIATPRTFAVDTERLEQALSVHTPARGTRPAGEAPNIFGAKGGLFFGSSVDQEQPAVGVEGAVFLRLTTLPLALYAHVRAIQGLDDESGFDIGVGVPFFAGSNPELSATLGISGGRLSYRFYDTAFGSAIEDTVTTIGSFVNLGYIPLEPGSFGFELNVRSYAALFPNDPDVDTLDGTRLMFEGSLLAIYRL